jgi:hypothetical protein
MKGENNENPLTARPCRLGNQLCLADLIMDEPINIQGTTGDMLKEPAAALFQHLWHHLRKNCRISLIRITE